MSSEDRERWDRRWAGEGACRTLEPHPLLVRYAGQLRGGHALDLACGRGQNALWLAAHGYTVDAVDISPVALEFGRAEAAQRGLSVNFTEADLDTYTLPVAAYDLIAVFYFLDRRLFPALQAALRPGGWLFYESFNVGRLAYAPDTPPAYLLHLGELPADFSSLQILEAGDQGNRPASSYMVCRKHHLPPEGDPL
jgi:SAM-dependent methyltransferase